MQGTQLAALQVECGEPSPRIEKKTAPNTIRRESQLRPQPSSKINPSRLLAKPLEERPKPNIFELRRVQEGGPEKIPSTKACKGPTMDQQTHRHRHFSHHHNQQKNRHTRDNEYRCR